MSNQFLPTRTAYRPVIGAVSLLLVLLLVPMVAVAGQGEPPMSDKVTMQPLSAVEVLEVPGINAQVEFAAADDIAAVIPGPEPYAVPTAVNLSLQTAGTWEALPRGGRLWRLQVNAPGATDLNFGFSHFILPQGATLHIISKSEDYYAGPFTAKDNKAHGQFWSPVVPGDEAVLELYVPSGVEEPELALSQVGSGFLDLFQRQPELNKQSGSCNIDVVCPDGEPWRDEIRSVARYSIGGAGLCTGTLIMDAEGTFTPFFLTANHCGITPASAPTLVFFWNYESPNCGDRSGGSLADTQSGATFRAARADVDMALVELDAQPDEAFNVFYSGWDRSDTTPGGSVGIHHPAGDVKAISFNDNALTTGDSCIGPVGAGNTHWIVDNWERGTTERGSSGSGLWDPANNKLVGFLSGGRAACGVLELDCYGKFSSAWEGATAAERLRDWLDPNGVGVMMVDGSDPRGGPPTVPGLPAEIPDNDPSGVASTQDVMTTGAITEMTVRVQIDHTWVGDLGITLTSPAGTEVVLLDRPGVPATTSGCSDNNMDITFSDTASLDPESHCERTEPWLMGDVLPVSALSTFNGEERQGTWTLSVTDGALFDLGQLVNWELNIAGGMQPPPILPADIPDNDPNGLPLTQEITTGTTLTDVNVELQIDHTYVGDLRVVLESPAGTQVVLLDRPGIPSLNANFGCSDNNMNVTFDDSASIDSETHCLGTGPWLAGPGLPAEALSAFNGESSQGTWRLIVSDNAAQDVGQVINWNLQLQ